MKITGIIWLDDVVDKLSWKHKVTTTEIEQVLSRNPRIAFKEKAKQNPDENLYVALGTTEAGRYLFVLFILKSHQRALILTARDMTMSEKKYYDKKRN
ncbi:BrnT family toxin [candidate division KSB1 bacterium]|nr:BrnT family toxin [candidate division KSB1 bacterium]